MFNDRRLYSPMPDLRNDQAPSRTPIRVCLIAASALMFALMAFIFYTGSAVLYVHFWVYIAAVFAIILLLLGAGAFAIHRRVKGEHARRNVAIVLVGVMLMLATTALAFCAAFMGYQKPAGFFDSPNAENRIVVMTSEADGGTLVTAYPAIGNHFYVAAIECEGVLSNGVVQGVEWEGERLAKVLLEDVDGNDVEIVVDFALLYAGESEAAAE